LVPGTTSVCAVGVADDPEPVDPPAEVCADKPVSAVDGDGDRDSASADSLGDFLKPPTDEPVLIAAFFGDGESDSESVDLSGGFPRCGPPADVSAVATFRADPLASDGDSDELAPWESPPESSAHATPEAVATAVPTPNDTARAPTRPTYLAYLI